MKNKIYRNRCTYNHILNIFKIYSHKTSNFYCKKKLKHIQKLDMKEWFFPI